MKTTPLIGSREPKHRCLIRGLFDLKDQHLLMKMGSLTTPWSGPGMMRQMRDTMNALLPPAQYFRADSVNDR